MVNAQKNQIKIKKQIFKFYCSITSIHYVKVIKKWTKIYTKVLNVLYVHFHSFIRIFLTSRKNVSKSYWSKRWLKLACPDSSSMCLWLKYCLEFLCGLKSITKHGFPYKNNKMTIQLNKIITHWMKSLSKTSRK